VPPPVIVRELPEAPEMTPEMVAKSVVVVVLSVIEIVRAAAFRLIGLRNSTTFLCTSLSYWE
jgi:hypothetical protein